MARQGLVSELPPLRLEPEIRQAEDGKARETMPRGPRKSPRIGGK
jgi:hypothetical protein